MQDSIEDYIRISKNAAEEPIKISKEVQITTQRKKEYDMRAMKIVEFSIDGKLRPEIFIRCLPFINPGHYQDIVEERAITKLCGYPICGKNIPEMPKKQYYISIRSNKVYDITDRKNYCSNFCYKASLHIKKQIDTSPLWSRKIECVPEYQLLDPTEGGLPGEFIDQGIVKPTVEPSFASISLFTEASLDDIVKREQSKDKSSKVKDKKSSKSKNISKPIMKTIPESLEFENNTEITVKTPEKSHGHESDKEVLTKIQETVQSKIVCRINDTVEETELNGSIDKNIKNSKLPVELQTKKVKKNETKRKQVDIESVIKKAIREWLTLETYIFIYGESKIKDILSEKKLSDCFEELNISELQRDQQLKYMNICRRLQLQEMADEKFDNILIGNPKLKPLPDYKQLKEENKDLTLKVKCFFSGVFHEKEDTNFPTQIKKNNETNSEEEPPVFLPLVDVNSQNAIRKKVFLISINKPMQLLLQSLRVTHFSPVLSDLQALVRTFNLKPDNVVFNPIVWNYIAVVLLHILSLRDKTTENILKEKESQKYIELQLSSLPNRTNFLNDIMTLVQTIDMFLENYISSK